MINYSELKRGVRFILNNQPHEIIESSSMFKGRGSSVLRAKIKNLITGNITSKTFHPADSFEEAEIKRLEAKFLYSHRDKFIFCEKENPAKRFELTKEQIGEQADFLKQNQIIEGSIFEKKIINISLPIKIALRVAEAPPGIKGNRAEAGTKLITLETGAKINAPLFIKEDDIVEVNTQTGEYSKRVE
ncbi:MAG: elongation factor P [Methanosarcinales archaeon]|nr:elongation factor P [Methanosarcinales archaeon]